MKPEDVPEGESIWDILAEGKAYCNEYPNDDEVTDEMILQAISWLGGTVENGFEREFHPSIFPFKEGDYYWTIEDGKPIWSCWDDQSEELFTLDGKYFSNHKAALLSVSGKKPFDVLISDTSNKFGAPMGRWSTGTEPKAGQRIYDRIVPMSSCGAYDKGGAYWGIGPTLRVRYTKDLEYYEYYRGNKRPNK